MSASVVAELSYQWRDFGKYTSPALQFLDLEGRVTALEKELRRAQKRASNAHRQAISTYGLRRRFWFEVEKRHLSTEDRLTRKVIRYTAKLLQSQYQKVELKIAWPSASSPFIKATCSTQVSEMIYQLLASDTEGVWFRIHPLMA